MQAAFSLWHEGPIVVLSKAVMLELEIFVSILWILGYYTEKHRWISRQKLVGTNV